MILLYQIPAIAEVNYKFLRLIPNPTIQRGGGSFQEQIR